ncbi:hypothetical protein J2X72_004250 [Phyllobacterium sp. 1468]|nr:hypothetical protein [Phyllobacterium sp. 1468]
MKAAYNKHITRASVDKLFEGRQTGSQISRELIQLVTREGKQALRTFSTGSGTDSWEMRTLI